jgi:hypothetical protein
MTQDFIRERHYLKAVSPKTLIWYGCSFRAFEGALESRETVNRRIVELRQRNVPLHQRLFQVAPRREVIGNIRESRAT